MKIHYRRKWKCQNVIDFCRGVYFHHFHRKPHYLVKYVDILGEEDDNY